MVISKGLADILAISKGLADILADNYDALRDCVTKKYASEHSDLAFTACVFELGYAPTDFGPFMLGGSRLLDTYAPLNGGQAAGFFRDRVREYQNQLAAAAGGSMGAVDSTIASTLSWHAKAARRGGVPNIVHEIFVVTELAYGLHGSHTHKQIRHNHTTLKPPTSR
jgi:hypothetical protein